MAVHILTSFFRCLLSSPIFVRCQRLIAVAGKIAELFSSNRAMSQYNEACGMMMWVEGPFVPFCCYLWRCHFHCHKLGCVWQNRWPWRPLGQYGVNCCPWRRPVASNVAHDVLHWAMCLVGRENAIEMRAGVWLNRNTAIRVRAGTKNSRPVGLLL
jgi:hypothetical protein